MDNLDISAMLLNLPNFLGLVFAIIILREQNMRMNQLCERLIDTIVKRENCE